MQSANKSLFYERLLLGSILLAGAVLRFWNLPDMPLMHDELSAFYRLQFGSFAELVEKGIKPDGHPAGIQVFLYYWTHWFGTSTPVLKLPFLLLGMGSIYLAYAIGKAWFGNTAGLLVAAAMASLQFPILYSQIARPYSSGLFFSLLMVLCWTRFLFGNPDKWRANLIGFVLAAALCCYNHYFSLLFAAIVGISGLFFMGKEQRNRYLLSGIAIVLLYLPHLPVFLAQLQLGGLQWLGQQGKTFPIEHLAFIFHHSLPVYLLMAILFFYGLYSTGNKRWEAQKFQILALAWFVLPMAIGFAYSRAVKPVLQHAVLLFSFPYLLFFIFSFYRPALVKWKTALMVAAILLVNAATLIWTRDHYTVFYKQPFKQFSLQTQAFLKNHSVSETTLVFNENPKYIDHYFRPMNPGVGYISLFDTGMGHVTFRDTLANLKSNYLVAGNVPIDFLPIIREFFPYTCFREDGFTYEYYVFSRNDPSCTIQDSHFESEPDFKSATTSNWTYDPAYVRDTPLNGLCYAMDSTLEWGPTLTLPLATVAHSRHDFVEVSLEMQGGCASCGVLVFEISAAGKNLNWVGLEPKYQMDTSLPADQLQKIYYAARLTHLFKTQRALEKATLKVYYWNREKEKILLKDIRLSLRTGNDHIYGLFEALDGGWFFPVKTNY